MTTGADDEATHNLSPERVQQRFHQEVESDLAVLGERFSGDPIDEPVFADLLASMSGSQPALSEIDVGRIAEQLADGLAKRFEDQFTSSTKVARFREDVRGITLGLLGGLLSTGTLNLLAYIAHVHPFGLDGASEYDEGAMRRAEEKRRRNDVIRRRLFEGMSDAAFYEFDQDLILRDHLKRLLWGRVLEHIQEADLTKELGHLPTFTDGSSLPATWLEEHLVTAVAECVGNRIEPDLSL